MNPHTDQSLRVAHSYIPNHHPTQYSWHIPPSQSHFPSSSSSYTMDSDLDYSEYQHDISALYRYPVSSARDEPYIPPPPPGPNDPPPPEPELLTPVYPPLRPEYQKYIRKYPRLVQKGLMSDGSFTQDHPLVDLYILTVPAKPNYILYPHENPDKEEPEALLFNQVCLLAKPLTPQDEEIIFVLAACKLLGSHKHPKHFTFWSELVWERTMARIHRMLQSETPLICVDIPYIDLCTLQCKQCEAWNTNTVPPWSKFRDGPAPRQTRNAAARATGRKREDANTKAGNGGGAGNKAEETSGTRSSNKRKQPPKAATKSRKKVKIAEPSSEQAAEAQVEHSLQALADAIEHQESGSSTSPSNALANLEPTTTREAKLERMASPSVGATLAELPDFGLSPLKATSPAPGPRTRNNRARRAPVAPTPAVAPSRRSARQAHKQASAQADEETPAMDVDELPSPATASPSTLSPATSSTSPQTSNSSATTVSPVAPATPTLLTSVSGEKDAEKEKGKGASHKRSRSSSSAASASSGTSTAVSSPSEGGLSTAVEEDGSPAPVKGLGLTVGEKDDGEEDKKTSKSKSKGKNTKTKAPPKAKAAAAPAPSKSNKRKRVEEEDEEEDSKPQLEEDQVEDEKEDSKPKRVSTRARKGTAKAIESKAEKVERPPPAKKAKTSATSVRSKAGKKGVTA